MAKELTPEEAAATVHVVVENTTKSPLFVNTVIGPKVCQPGGVTEPVEMREAEVAQLPAGLKAKGAPATEELTDDSDVEIDDDLLDDGQRDGIIKKADLVEKAKAEEVEFESDDNKTDLVRKIMLKRTANAE